MPNQVKIALGVPAYGGKVVATHLPMFLSIGNAFGKNPRVGRTTTITVDTCGVARARNTLLAHAMSLGNDWLLMFDADTWVEGDDPGVHLSQMLFAAFEEHNATIVGAPVRRRGADGVAVYREIEGNLVQMTINPADFPRFVEVDAIGAAVMAINLHKIDEKTIFEFNEKASEDIAFCTAVRKAGGKILVETCIATAHTGIAPILRY